MNLIEIPSYESMMNPLLQSLDELGGSGTVEEIENKVGEILDLSDEQLELLHNPEKGGRTEFGYKLAWTRTYLKQYGLLENSTRGVWALTTKGRAIKEVDEREVVRTVKAKQKERREQEGTEEEISDEADDTTSWQDNLLSTVLKMDSSAFERLVKRLLRESGFTQVEVTGQSGDGGVDGKGILRMGGLLSFHVIFQCKKYAKSVTPAKVRDFRGAMVGRADKGLLVTTGTFTKDAIREATRDGAPAIDLIDGEQLVQLLKQFSIGVQTETVQVEQVTIDHEWFSSI